jgi:hypothetical protein
VDCCPLLLVVLLDVKRTGEDDAELAEEDDESLVISELE